jgi:hypothetical protein
MQRRRQGWAAQRELLATIFDAERPAHAPDLDTAANLTFTAMHGIASAAISGRLWGPHADTEELLRRTRPLVDALVDQWAAAWGLQA